MKTMLACPFCGSPGEVNTTSPDRFYFPSCTNSECVACVYEQDEQGGTHLDVGSKEKAIEIWNRRV